MWIYRSEIQQYVNGIKGAREISLHFHLRAGGFIKLKVHNATAAMQMTAAVADRAPWAVAGYSMGLEDAWKRDRAGWIAEVDERRKNPGVKEKASASSVHVSIPPSEVSGQKPHSGLVFGLGLGSLFVPLPIGIIALVLGIREKRDESKGKLEPKGLTTAGIVLGIIGTVFQGIMLVTLITHSKF